MLYEVITLPDELDVPRFGSVPSAQAEARDATMKGKARASARGERCIPGEYRGTAPWEGAAMLHQTGLMKRSWTSFV